MGFHSKFKINLYLERFPEAFRKYTRFPKFTLLFRGEVMRVLEERLCAAKFTAAFYEV